MRTLMRWIYILAATVAVAAVLNFLLLPQIIVHVLKDQIEIKGSEALGLRISVEAIKMNALFPFFVRLQKVRAGDESLAFDIEEVSLKLFPRYENDRIIVGVDFLVREPQVVLQKRIEKKASSPGGGEKSTESVSTWNQTIFGVPLIVPLRVRVQGGQFKIFYDVLNYLELKSVDLNFLGASVLNHDDPLELDVTAGLKVQHSPYALELPLAVSSKTLLVSSGSVETTDMKISLGGVESFVRGKTSLDSMSHAWKLTLNVPALEKLPVPAQFLPTGVWSGGVQGAVDFRQVGGGDPEVRANFETKNLVGDVDFKTDDLRAKGRLRALLSWNLNYIKGEVSAPRVSVSVNSDDMALSKGSLFTKKPGQPLNFRLNGYVTKNVFVLNVLKATLDRIRLDAAGFVGMVQGKRSDLTLRIPKTSLRGLEKMFPPLAQQPAQGTLSLEARIAGDPFRGLEGMDIIAKPVRLSGFSTTLNYRDDKSKVYVIGPVRADVQAIVRSRGSKVENTTVQGGVDLSQLEVSYGKVFQKKMGSPLKLKVKIGNKGQNLTTSGSSLSIDKGALHVSGTLSGFADPRMRLQLSMKKLPIHQILKMTGHYEAYPMDGELGGEVSVRGQWQSAKGIEASPLVVSGELSSQIRHIKYKTEPPVKGQDTPDIEVPKLKEVPPVVPAWKIVESMNVGFKGTIGELSYEDLKMHGVSYKVRLQKGQLAATANVQKVFGGHLAVRSLKVPVLRSNPRVQVNALAKGVQLQSLLGFALPEYKKEAAGSISLQLDTSAEMPSSVRFVSSLKGLVSLTSPELTVRSLKLSEVINQSLRKIPKAKVSPVKVEGFVGSVALIAAFADGSVKLNKLDIQSIKKDQLQLKGQMDIEGGVNLRGAMSLAKPPMGGDIYLCNADKMGRFVVPIFVKGRWNQPSFSFASSTIEALVKKTLTCQVRREKKKVQQKLDKELEGARESLTKDLENQAKDKLKGLFK